MGGVEKKIGGCERERRVLKGDLAGFGRPRDPYAERLVFVDEMGANISLAPLAMLGRDGESGRMLACRATLGEERHLAGEHDLERDGPVPGGRRLDHEGGL